MPAEHDPPSPQRDTMLTVVLCALVAMGGVVFMVGLMGMFVIHALTIVGGLALFGSLHYFLWGRSLSQEISRDEASHIYGGSDTHDDFVDSDES